MPGVAKGTVKPAAPTPAQQAVPKANLRLDEIGQLTDMHGSVRILHCASSRGALQISRGKLTFATAPSDHFLNVRSLSIKNSLFLSAR